MKKKDIDRGVDIVCQFLDEDDGIEDYRWDGLSEFLIIFNTEDNEDGRWVVYDYEDLFHNVLITYKHLKRELKKEYEELRDIYNG